jgi:UDP-N-acetylmuramoyl-L-alanyl-D-glutamate--2,6-diaminopimelate ligase
MKARYLNEILSQDFLLKHRIPDKKMIEKIVYDSRKVNDMSLFVAISGYNTDGHEYLKQAQEKGAVAAIVEKENNAISLPQYLVPNSREALALLAARFYSPEASQMRLAGITGTNGKTTTAFLLQSVFAAAGLKSGLIGTIYYHIGNKKIKAWNTTPESVDLFQMLYEMSVQGQSGCILEASSHGLALHRLDYLQFEVAVFTNLTQDHLDFHEDFESYYQAKKKLFSLLKKGGRAVINLEDAYGRRLLDEIQTETITFSTHKDAAVRAIDWKSCLKGTQVEITTPQGDLHIDSPLIGEFNVENILAATAAGLAMNFDLKTIRTGIESVERVAGRLEPVTGSKDKTMIVDYSHTPDALQKALIVLEALTKGELWVVFGCGGNRDKTKRPLMGKIAEEGADHVILTSDNPRSEPAAAIIADILAGISDKRRVVIQEDRRKAIRLAISGSKPGDTILVAGKGHEDYQEIEGIKYPFDDREVIHEELA